MRCVKTCLSQLNTNEKKEKNVFQQDKKLHSVTKRARGRPKKIIASPNTNDIKLEETIINNVDNKTSGSDIEILTTNHTPSNNYKNDMSEFPDFLIDHVYDATKTYYPHQHFF